MNDPSNSSPRPARSALPWVALFFVLPALLLALLVALLLPAPPALAVTRTVCATGADYTTIQAAVNAAQAGDVIDICAGSYAETVDLSAMVPPGDLTLRGTGTVQITPTAGAAITISLRFTGNVTLDNLHVWSADNHAINFGNVISGNLSLVSVVAVDAARNGLAATVVGSTSISNSTISDNGESGAFLDITGPVTVTNSLFINNGLGPGSGGLAITGSPAACGSPNGVVIDGVTATDNQGPGIFLMLNTGGAQVTDSTANRNTGGLYVIDNDPCGAPVVIDQVTANDNSASSAPVPASGVYVAAKWAQITNVTATGNTGHGVEHSKSSPVPLGALAPAAVNGPTPPPSNLVITNTTAFSNSLNGFALDAADYVTLTNVSAVENVAIGIALSVTNQAFGAVSTAAFDSTNATSHADIANVLVVSNAVGVWINDITQQQVAAAGATGGGLALPVTVHNSLLCGNQNAGLAATGNYSSTYNAVDNFWGDLTGPYNQARNPTGLGNSVIDGNWGQGNGYVLFFPWLDSVAINAATNPLVVGGDNELTAFFYSSSSPSFLGEGPGNLNDPPPFTLAAENGSFTTAYGTGASAPARVDDTGILTGLLNPTASGPVTITVSGPCDSPIISQTFSAVAPQLVVTKRPALQTVLPNSTVTFTVDFTNTGDLPLQNVIVTDTLAPGCSATIGDLAIGATEQVTCTAGPVVVDFTNVVTVTGNPVPETPSAATVDVPPDQVVVTATAAADVDVVTPGLTATKTAGTDANACAQPGSITVPSGSSIYYCLRLTNSGDVTLTHHTVSDPLLGINLPFTYTLAPGASLPITHSLIAALGPIAVSAPITNVFAVTSTGVITEVGGVVVPPVPVSVQSSANVVVRTPSTGLTPGEEPLIDNYLFLPSLKK